MTALDAWSASRTAGSPEALRGRVMEWLAELEGGAGGADGLARAGMTALNAATGHSGDRSVALDLLAADALVTLALLHQAEHDPAGLEAFARRVRMTGAAQE